MIEREDSTRHATRVRLRELMDGMLAYQALVRREQRDPKFVLHPTTWLNGEHWADEHGPVAGTGRDAIRDL